MAARFPSKNKTITLLFLQPWFFSFAHSNDTRIKLIRQADNARCMQGPLAHLIQTATQSTGNSPSDLSISKKRKQVEMLCDEIVGLRSLDSPSPFKTLVSVAMHDTTCSRTAVDLMAASSGSAGYNTILRLEKEERPRERQTAKAGSATLSSRKGGALCKRQNTYITQNSSCTNSNRCSSGSNRSVVVVVGSRGMQFDAAMPVDDSERPKTEADAGAIRADGCVRQRQRGEAKALC
jgi:hypothetical protein